MSEKQMTQEILNLDTNRLNIRKIEKQDASFIYDLRSNKDNMRYVEMSPYINIERAKSFIEHVLLDIEKNEVFFWVIERKDKSVPIGTICLWSFSKEKDKAEIGYELLQAYQKKGYANEALNTVINFAKEKLNLKIIDAITHEDHKASINLLIRNNFISLGYVHEFLPAAEDGPEMKLFRKKL